MTEAEWLAARASVAQRLKRRGRGTGVRWVNVFAGLLREARGGDSYQMSQQRSRNPDRPARAYPVLLNGECDQGGGRAYSFPYLPFEAAVLAGLREVSAADVLPATDTNPNDLLALSAELDGVEAELAQAEPHMEANGFSPTIAKHVAKLEAKKADVSARLSEVRQEQAVPAADAWKRFGSLADAVASAPDPNDARLRLRRTVSEMVLLVVPRGATRLAAVTVAFAGSEARRNFLIAHRQRANPGGSGPTPARWAVLTIRHPDDRLPFDNWNLRSEYLTETRRAGVGGWREVQAYLEGYPSASSTSCWRPAPACR